MGATAVAVATDDSGGGIVTAYAQGDQIVFYRFIWHSGIAGWSVMHFQPPERPIVVTEPAAVLIQRQSFETLLPPCVRLHVGLVGYLHRHLPVPLPIFSTTHLGMFPAPTSQVARL